VVAVLQPTRGNNVSGTVWFLQDGAMVDVRGRVSGLAPNQEHGFHVHEKGDCSSEDAMSAGEHLNPTAKRHGPPEGEHHAGDLPALKADAKGEASIHARVAGTVLGAGAGDLAGKALVVHARSDDYATQPSGNSGARIACGVISTTAGRDAAGNPIQIPKDL
jgi:Cu-Zn family superoxide dismutase